MWYPATVTAAPASEPASAAVAKAQTRIDHSDDDALIERLITVARAHVEKYTGLRLVTQTIAIKCDYFSDLARLPDGPVQSITSVVYTDADGIEQTLATTVYELRSDGLDAGLVLKFGQSWPSLQSGSRITVTAVVGYAAVPEPIVHAILLQVASHFEDREDAPAIAMAVSDALLSNYRLGV